MTRSIVQSFLLSLVVTPAVRGQTQSEIASSNWIGVNVVVTDLRKPSLVTVDAPLITRDILEHGAVIVYFRFETRDAPVHQLPIHKVSYFSVSYVADLNEATIPGIIDRIIISGEHKRVYVPTVQSVDFSLEVGKINLAFVGNYSGEHFVQYVVIPIRPGVYSALAADPSQAVVSPVVSDRPPLTNPWAVLAPNRAPIRSALNNKELGVSGRGDDGEAVMQFGEHDRRARTWYFEPLSGLDQGFYLIHIDGSDACLDVTGGSTADGALVILFRCSGTDNQKWRIIPIGGSDAVLLEAKHSGKVLDVPGSSPDDAVQVTQYTRHGGPNQQWLIANHH